MTLSGDCTSPRQSSRFHSGGSLNRTQSAESALTCSRASDNGTGIAQALCCLANMEAHRGNLSEAEVLFDEAGRAAADATDPVLENLSLASAFSIAYNRRDIERCLALGQRWLDHAVTLGDRPAEARARGRLGIALSAAGNAIRGGARAFRKRRALLLPR